jgi:SAM-dependent methyltransferase
MYGDDYDELIAKSYDAVYAKIRDPSGDAAFYFDLAKASGGSVLELGCGTGRILIPIARAGIPCVGLDASPAMLRVFKEKDSSVELVRGDMRDFHLGRQFRLITIPFRAFQHLLDVESQLACLACVREHLAPGGTFALDVFDPKLEAILEPESVEALGAEFDGTKRWEKVSRDRTRQIIDVTFRFEGAMTGEAKIQMRWFYRYELEHLLARAGFRDLEFFGGFDRRPWTAGGETILSGR